MRTAGKKRESQSEGKKKEKEAKAPFTPGQASSRENARNAKSEMEKRKIAAV